MSNEIAVHNPSALADQMRFAEAVASDRSASLLPEQYRGNRANVLIAVGLGASMGLSPAESLYRISVIKGKPSAGAELIAANVRKAGHKLRVRGDEQSCTASIVRADDPDFTFEVTRDLAWAKQMGLATNDNYKKQPGTMLQWRAITAVARLACPEALYGVQYTPDEAASFPDDRPAAPKPTAADFVKSEPVPEQDIHDAEVVEDADKVTDRTRKHLFALLNEQGITGRDEQIRGMSHIIGRQIASRSELTENEAQAVVMQLESRKAQQAPTEDRPADLWTEEEQS